MASHFIYTSGSLSTEVLPAADVDSAYEATWIDQCLQVKNIPQTLVALK